MSSRPKISLNELRYRKGQELLEKAFKSITKEKKNSRRDARASSAEDVEDDASKPSLNSTRTTTRILKEGILWKEGRHRNWTPAYGGIGIYPWKKRWVKVYEDGRIEWRSERNQILPNGSIHIAQYRVSEPAHTANRKQYQIGLVANELGKRSLKFRTDTMKDAKEWTNKLIASVGIPKLTRDVSGYRFICHLTRSKTHKEVIAAIKPIYKTQQVKRGRMSEAKQIGEGSFADVYVVNRLSDGIKLACKRVHVKPPDDRLTHLDEIQIMRRMDHPFIIRVLDCYLTTNEPDNVAYIFMEYCGGGSVASRLKSLRGGVFEDADAVRFARQILSALCYLHEKGIVHRDVKLENVLYVFFFFFFVVSLSLSPLILQYPHCNRYRTSAKDSPVVLVDFGISRCFRDKRRLMTSAVGSPWYALFRTFSLSLLIPPFPILPSSFSPFLPHFLPPGISPPNKSNVNMMRKSMSGL